MEDEESGEGEWGGVNDAEGTSFSNRGSESRDAESPPEVPFPPSPTAFVPLASILPNPGSKENSSSQEDTIRRLNSLGLQPDTISYAVNVPIDEIIQVLSGKPPAPDEKELVEEARSLTALAIRQATRLLLFGSTDVRLSIIKSLLGGTSRLAGGDSAHTEEQRQQLEILFSAMRVPLPSPATSILATTLTSSNAPHPRTPSQNSHDQD